MKRKEDRVVENESGDFRPTQSPVRIRKSFENKSGHHQVRRVRCESPIQDVNRDDFEIRT